MTKDKKVVYCHFSFRRPKGKNYGLFSTAFYWDYDGTKLITYKTRKMNLWKDHQFVTAIQAYENALSFIHEYQGQMIEAGIRQVMLVVDNSILAGWIENPKKNKQYTAYMERAVKPYRVGGPKEIRVAVGLCEVRDYEKSYKYCKEELVTEDLTKTEVKAEENRIKLTGEYKSALDIIKDDISVPEMDGIEEVKLA